MSPSPEQTPLLSMATRPLLLLLLLIAFDSAVRAEGAYLGAYLAPADKDGKSGIELALVAPGSPAELAGLRKGDLVIAWGSERPKDQSAGEALASFKALLEKLSPGARLELTLQRSLIEGRLTSGGTFEDFSKARLPELDALLQNPGQELQVQARRKLEISRVTVVLGQRPERRLASLPPWSEIAPPMLRQPAKEDEEFVSAALSGADYRPALDDLHQRFAADELNDDAFRLPLFRALHLQPQRSMSLLPALKDRAARGLVGDASLEISAFATELFSAKIVAEQTLGRVHNWQSFSLSLERVLGAALQKRRQALGALRSEDQKALATLGRDALADRFSEHIYIHSDENRERLSQNLRSLESLAAIDRGVLAELYATLTPVLQRERLQEIREILRAEFKGRSGLILSLATSVGRIELWGEGDDEHLGGAREEGGAAIIIDLGGDDRYLGCPAASQGEAAPLAMILDLGGDDRYQSSEPAGLCAASLGLSLLLDLEGDDLYLSSRPLAQAAAFGGVALLYDFAGEDEYRATSLAQGSVLCQGIAALVDLGGNDSFNAHAFSQGFGGPGGLGLCWNRGGDDSYQLGGGAGSSYGETGIFQGFGQGASCGFRSLASGGLGWMADSGGRDRYSAGNFSQGGGYYFGLGVLTDLGWSNDRYWGSRYAQGFSAHSAGGLFYEDGGDDRYAGLVGALQGAAWDLSFALFWDASGDDRYDGHGAFSLGASAHNGWAVFYDALGADHYKNAQGLARSGPNDYHGGHSLSLFIDAGLGENRFVMAEAEAFLEPARTRFRRGSQGPGSLWLELRAPLSTRALWPTWLNPGD